MLKGKTILLGVSGSIAAYNRLGFQKVRTQKADIGGGFFMDDDIMEKTIA